MTTQEQIQFDTIDGETPTDAQVKAARAFIESHGFQYTTTALRAIAAVLSECYDNAEMGGVVAEASNAMARIEAVTI